ncbi:MAG: hypothetical protein EA426_06510 [Spirochaetaceae bacterium]|nr:MAG: hypothetical protein EA426_06510 [Spirochaetaceae bacterium]
MVSERRDSPKKNDDTDSAGGAFGILDRIFSVFLSGGDPEREKRRQLKLIGKQLSKERLKFYKPKTQEVQPALARFFFDVYRTVGPANNLLQNAAKSETLRQVVIEARMSEQQRALKEQFTEESIRSRAGEVDMQTVAAEIKDSMVRFFGGFDHTTVNEVNRTYNTVLMFVNLAVFDFYFLLKKFDSAIQENNFVYKPKFEAINGEYVSDDLKDFLELILPLERDLNWDAAFDTLSEFRGVEIVDRSAWKRVLSVIENVRRSEVLSLMIRHIDGKPAWTSQARVPSERIVEGYLNKLKTTTEATIQKLVIERKNRKIEQLSTVIFGTTVVTRTKYYTEKANLMFSKKMIAGFLHTDAINYMKAFLLDYYKKDFRELIRDLLLVRGTWSENITSQRLSDAFHAVLEISNEVVEFDDSLAEEGELGIKLKKAVGRVVERDPSTVRVLRDTLDAVNGKAAKMITECASQLIEIGRHLKDLITDYERPKHELILNWKELEAASDRNLKERMVEVYKKTYYFVQLMQVYAKRMKK